MATRDYSGTAQLLNDEGQVIDEVTVALRYTQNPHGLGEWARKIHPANISPGDWMLTRKIRLSNDKTADAFVQNVNYTDQGTQNGWLVGSGPPPF